MNRCETVWIALSQLNLHVLIRRRLPFDIDINSSAESVAAMRREHFQAITLRENGETGTNAGFKSQHSNESWLETHLSRRRAARAYSVGLA